MAGRHSVIWQEIQAHTQRKINLQNCWYLLEIAQIKKEEKYCATAENLAMLLVLAYKIPALKLEAPFPAVRMLLMHQCINQNNDKKKQ